MIDVLKNIYKMYIIYSVYIVIFSEGGQFQHLFRPPPFYIKEYP